jgi:hypothetical protein
MSIYTFLDTIFEEFGEPYAAVRYIDPPLTYITYKKYDERPIDSADDKVTARQYFIQVDVWSNKAPFNLAQRLRDFLEDKGFISGAAASFYEEDTQIFHEGMRFSYILNKHSEDD